MVKYQNIEFDRLLYAISDQTRRSILDDLYRGEKGVGELAEPFNMSLPGFLKHLNILKGTGLVITKKTGRRVTCNINPENLIRVATWLAKYQKTWEDRLRELEANIKQNKLQSGQKDI
ncbi:metalloregulator ArsR/SmtB family transcription factor [Candidatus Parcubacteria bacterium]|nr:metalloregulator ArsR/SmtB family transcription factor [Candidatus Parcubacteria bacterium]